MSKIHKYQEMADFIRPYKLEPFTETDFREEPKSAETQFVPDQAETERAEFVKGGFDFDISGGLRREEILRRSTDEAEQIVATAKAEADAIRQTAHDDGYSAGVEEGKGVGIERTIPLIDTFTHLVEELNRTRGEFYASAEKEMIDLVTAVARTIIDSEIAQNPELIRPVILRAVEHLQSREEMSIRINPADLTEAEKLRPELAKKVEDIDKVTLRSDPLISRGGCAVETNIGSIDARLETQLEAVRESLITAVDEATASSAGKSITPDDENADTET